MNESSPAVVRWNGEEDDDGMELRAFSICRGCFEVYASSRFCPHCAADNVAVAGATHDVPAPAVLDDDAVSVDDPAPERGGLWLAGVAVAGLALALLAAVASVA